MPGINGVTLARRIRAMGFRMPIVLMSGEAVSPVDVAGVQVIRKPTEMDDLVLVERQLMRRIPRSARTSSHPIHDRPASCNRGVMERPLRPDPPHDRIARAAARVNTAMARVAQAQEQLT